MKSRRAVRLVATRSFWKGVSSGMRSPAGRRGFNTAYRRSVWPAAIGSIALSQWVMHARVRAGQPPLNQAGVLEVCTLGAVAGFVVVRAVEWLWRRWSHEGA